MSDQVEISIPKTKWPERSAFVATAYFRDRATAAADTPTSVKYRIECLTTGNVLADWTTVTPASSVTVPVTATHNAIQDDCNAYETKQLLVAADYGAADQHIGRRTWRVENLVGVT